MSLKRFFNRDRWDAERARELESYVAMEIDDNIARGMAPDEARQAALRKIGNRTLVREEIYWMNTVGLIDTAWRDLKYGARLLRLNPGFAIVAISAASPPKNADSVAISRSRVSDWLT